jgi:hypothetical protein
MSPNNNNIRGLKNVKRCPNKCKTWIAWSQYLNRFVEANGVILIYNVIDF